MLPYLEQAWRAGAATLRDLAAALPARGVPRPRAGPQVKRVLAAATAPRDDAAP